MADIDRLQGPGNPLQGAPVPGANAESLGRPRGPSPPAGAASFGELLKARQGIASGAPLPASELRFSAHAQTRLQSRKISIGDAQMARLQGAVDRAASKGSRDSLVLMDDLAMVVSVKNRTVVTVVDSENLKQNVFTNIDSAVIA